MHSMSVPSILRQQGSLLYSSLSLSASCSSDACSNSLHSQASTGRTYRTSSSTIQRRQLASKPKVLIDSVSAFSHDGLQPKKRCACVTPSTGNCLSFLFSLGDLTDLTWPAILSKRHIFREVFADFDPITISKFNEKKIIAPSSAGSSLLSELKLWGIVENTRQISKVMDEFGSSDKYIWSFVNYEPMDSRFWYPRQVPVKMIPKAGVISKDLVRRGFRSVGPTVVYSFMQVAGMTNDHLISCFRFHECISAVERKEKMKSNVPVISLTFLVTDT